MSNSFLKYSILSFFVTFLVLVICIFYFPNNKNDEDIIFYVKKGQLAGYIYDDLSKEGLIISRNGMSLYSMVFGTTAKLRAGYYIFPKHASICTVNNYLVKGIHPVGEIAIIDGMTEKDVNEEIKKAPYLGKTYLTGKDIGLLFPDTYHYEYGDDAIVIIDQAKRKMAKIVNELWEKRQNGIPIRNKEQFVTVASILEKEVKNYNDMQIAASIIYNRLKKRIHLGIDATLLYGFERDAFIHEDKSKNHPYNTYKRYGLPPTPISFPGINALKAAVYPKNTDYLYYIAFDNDIKPARTYIEHKANINMYLK